MILLLSLALAGQSAAPSRPVMATRNVIQIYVIRHEGLTFRVRGYYRPDINRIVWNEDDEFNSRTYSTALISQATFGDEQEGPHSAVRKPLVASRPAYRPEEQVVGMQPSKVRRP